MGVSLLGALPLLLGPEVLLGIGELFGLELPWHWGLKRRHRVDDQLGRLLEELERLAFLARLCGLAALLEQVHRGAATLYIQISILLTYLR